MVFNMYLLSNMALFGYPLSMSFPVVFFFGRFFDVIFRPKKKKHLEAQMTPGWVKNTTPGWLRKSNKTHPVEAGSVFFF